MFEEKPHLPEGTAARGEPTDLGFPTLKVGVRDYVVPSIGVEFGDTTTAWGSAVEAHRLSENIFSDGEALERAHDARIDAITKAGIKHSLRNPTRLPPSSVPNEMGEAPEPTDHYAEFGKQLRELEAANPDKADVIKAWRSVRDDALLLRNQAAERAADVYSRTRGTVGPALAQFGGAFHGGVYDPVNVAALAAGPWGRVGVGAGKVLWMGIKTGAVNASAVAAGQPLVQKWRAEAGIDAPALDYGWELAAKNIGLGFATGLGLDFGVRGAFRGGQKVFGRVPVVDEAGKVTGYKWRNDEAGLAGNIAEAARAGASNIVAAYRAGRITAEQAMEAVAKKARPGSILRKAADGDLDARHRIAKQVDVAEDPSIKGARQAAEIEAELAGRTPSLVDPDEGFSSLTQAIRASREENEPLPRGVDPVPPARRGFERLADDGPNPPSSFKLDGKPAGFREVPASEIGFDAETFQFKRGGNAQGVTQRLEGVQEWDPLAAGRAIVYERIGTEAQTFKTAKGSTYEVHADGTTTRNKALRSEPGHEGDQGLKPKSDRTIYVSAEDAQRLGEFQAQGSKKAVALTKDGRVGVKYLEGKDAGKFERRTVVTFKTKPEKGLTPVEIWKDGSQVHFGNEIVEVIGGGGRMVIADGHQRLALAHRLEQTGSEPVSMPATVFREADGWTPGDIRALAARKNLQEGSGDVLDAARAIRERPDIIDSSVPLTADAMRQARALARLSDEAFAEVMGGKVQPNHAALVGDLVEALSQHAPIVRALAEADPNNVREARHIIGDLIHGPQHEVQEVLLGGHANQMLLPERAQVLDKALKLLKEDAKIFEVLSKEVDRISQVGNKLAVDANASRVLQSETVSALIETLAVKPGPVREWLDDAARSVANGMPVKKAAKDFADRVRKQLLKNGFEGLKPELPAPLRGRGIDDPGGAEAKAQVAELEEALDASIKGVMRKVADRNLNKWLNWQRLNNRVAPELNPLEREAAVRLIATGEDVRDAVRAARQSVADEKAALAEARVLAEAERIERETIAPEEIDNVVSMWLFVDEVRRVQSEGFAAKMPDADDIQTALELESDLAKYGLKDAKTEAEVRARIDAHNRRVSQGEGAEGDVGASSRDGDGRPLDPDDGVRHALGPIDDAGDGLIRRAIDALKAKYMDSRFMDWLDPEDKTHITTFGNVDLGVSKGSRLLRNKEGMQPARRPTVPVPSPAAVQAELKRLRQSIEDTVHRVVDDKAWSIPLMFITPDDIIAKAKTYSAGDKKAFWLGTLARQLASVKNMTQETQARFDIAVLKRRLSTFVQDLDATNDNVRGPVPVGDADVRFALGPIEDGEMQRRAFDALGFYSHALEAAKSLKQSKGTPEQMLEHLLEAGGVKESEIRATKLDEFLLGKTLDQYFAENVGKPTPVLSPERRAAFQALREEVKTATGPRKQELIAELQRLSQERKAELAEFARVKASQPDAGQLEKVTPAKLEIGKGPEAKSSNPEVIKRFSTPAVNAIRESGAFGPYSVRETTQFGKIASDNSPNWDVLRNGVKVGDFWLAEKADGVYVLPRVEESARRQGVNTAIFDFVEQAAASVGKRLLKQADADLTPDGAAFWAARSNPDAGVTFSGGASRSKPSLITKSEIIKFLEENRVEVRESKYGGVDTSYDAQIDHVATRRVDDDENVVIREYQVRGTDDIYEAYIDNDAGSVSVRDPDGEWLDIDAPINRQTADHALSAIHKDAMARTSDVPPDVRGPAKWQQYSIDPDNPTRRQHVLHLPSRERKPLNDPESESLLDDDILAEIAPESKYGTDFRDSHFPDEPNPIVNLDTSIQKTLEGEPAYNVDRFQMQWAQAIRDSIRNAYAKEMFGPESPAIKARIAELEKQIDDLTRDQFGGETAPARMTRLAREVRTGRADRSEYNDPRNKLHSEVASLQRQRSFSDLTKEQKAEISKSIDKDRKAGTLKGGVRDEGKIAELEKRQAGLAQKIGAAGLSDTAIQTLETHDWLPERALNAIRTARDGSEHHPAAPKGSYRKSLDSLEREITGSSSKIPDLKELLSERGLVEAELQNAKAATPSHPMVATTKQAMVPAIGRMVRLAVEADAKYIAITPADVLIARGEGDANNPAGMRQGHDVIFVGEVLDYLRARDPSIKAIERKPLQSSMDGRTFKPEQAAEEVEADRYLARVGGDIDVALRVAREDRRQLRDAADSPVTEQQVYRLNEVLKVLEAGKAGTRERVSPILFHTFPLTPKVKASVLEDGQPLFATAGGGSKGEKPAVTSAQRYSLDNRDVADRSARQKIDRLVEAGRPYDVPMHAQAAHLSVLKPMGEHLLDGWEMALVSRVEPIGNGDVKVTLTTLNGGLIEIEDSWRSIRSRRATTFASDKLIALFRFDLARNFGHSLQGEAVHEIGHMLYVSQASSRLDSVGRRLLVRHAESLRVLDMPANDFFAKVGRRDLVGRSRTTLREIYERDYSTYPNKSQMIAEEAAMHMAELIHHGAIPAKDVMPILPILERMFGDHIGRRLQASEASAQFVFLGPRAYSADLTKLDAAQKMVAEGRGDFEIFEATGWFRDTNNEWVFQIPRDDVQLGMWAEKTAKGQIPGKNIVGEAEGIVQAPALFKAYPELQDIVLNLQHRRNKAPVSAADLDEGSIDVMAGSAARMREGLIDQFQRFINEIEKRPMGEPRAMQAIRKATQDLDREAADVMEKLGALDDAAGRQIGTDADREAFIKQLADLRQVRGDLDRLDWVSAWRKVEKAKDDAKPRSATSGDDDMAPDDWEASLFEEMSRRSAVVEKAIETRDTARAPKSKVLDESKHPLEVQIAKFERGEWAAGKSAKEIAASIEAKFGFPVDPVAVAKREVWWLVDTQIAKAKGHLGHWPSDVRAEFARLWDAGAKTGEIRARIGDMLGRPVSDDAVSTQRHAMGLARRTGLPGDVRAYIMTRLAERADGETKITAQMISDEVAEKFGIKVKPEVVRPMARRGGLAKDRFEWTPEAISLLTSEDLASLNMKQKAALLRAKGFDVSYDAVKNQVRRMRLAEDQKARFAVGGDDADYRGEHGAPDHESGSPIHDVTLNGIYPADFYGPEGLRYYGTGNDDFDGRAFAKIMGLKGKPDEKVAVWRAVPFVEGKPKGVSLHHDHIRPGDWVTIIRDYAKDHGESALNGNYHISKRIVPASELFTAGDSFLEWGWSPKAAAGAAPADEVIPVFRGESAHNRGGKFYSTDREWTRQFTQGGRDSEIMARAVKASDVYDPPSHVYAGDFDAIDAVVAEARAKGFKAVRLSEAKGLPPGEGEPASIYVFNRTALKAPQTAPDLEPRAAANNEGLAYLVGEKSKVGVIGAETGTVKPDGVSVLKLKSAPEGYQSVRVVYSKDGQIVGAMQVTKTPDGPATVANTYVVPEHRRAGIASQLNRHAVELFGTLERSEGPSPAGQAFRDALSRDEPRLAVADDATPPARSLSDDIDDAASTANLSELVKVCKA